MAAALIAGEPQELLARAAITAVSTRDRQLVAVASAHLDGNNDVLDVLVREHLSEFPDNIVAACIAAEHPNERYDRTTDPEANPCTT